LISLSQLDHEVRSSLYAAARTRMPESQARSLGQRAQVVLWAPLDREHARNRRRYAQCIPSKVRFEFAEATLALDDAHRSAVVAHEVGHVIEQLTTGRTSERGADRTAKQTLGVDIGYDMSWPGKGLQVARGTNQLLSPFPFDRRIVFADRELPGGVPRQVRLANLKGTQRLVRRDGVEHCLKTDVGMALVYETKAGVLYLADGHHRLVAELIKGREVATVRVLAVEPVKSRVGALTR
jgi:hypothetical protein